MQIRKKQCTKYIHTYEQNAFRKFSQDKILTPINSQLTYSIKKSEQLNLN